MKKIASYLPSLILITSLVLGAFLRFYKLGISPSGFYIDEASIGYNAYSILKTGADEFGKPLPVMFRSFSTFQSPIYTYLSVPIVALFGLSPFSTRLISALLGFFSLPLFYFLILKLLRHQPTSKNIALFATLFLAISPWHILYSRTAYEANVALFLLLLGFYFLTGIFKKPWLLVVATITLLLSIIAYRAEILIVPALVVMFFIVDRKVFIVRRSEYLPPLIFSLMLGLILIYPTLKIIPTSGFKARTSALSIFSNDHEFPWGKVSGVEGKMNIINNHSLISLREFASLYTSYFSPRYLFSLGDSGPRKPYPDIGSFFAWQFPLYILGLYSLIKEKEYKKLKLFVFTLLFISPIPAALTRDPYSTLRSLPMVIPLTIIIAFGLNKVLSISNPFLNKTKYFALFILFIFSTLKLFISVFYHHDYYRSVYWSYGWQEAVGIIEKLNPSLPIIVDGLRGHPYIELLFFLKYDPAVYQKANFEVSLSEYYTNLQRSNVKKIGNITVKNFQWGIDTDREEKYLIVDSQAISDQQILEHNITKIADILYPNKQIALRILKTNPSQ